MFCSEDGISPSFFDKPEKKVNDFSQNISVDLLKWQASKLTFHLSADSNGNEDDMTNFVARIHGRSARELDRDLAEEIIEASFLEEQITVDLQSYSPSDLQKANERVSVIKKKCELLRAELESRQ
jgi:hypothetical protein